MNRWSRLWGSLRASFWFTPALIVLASMAAAVALVEADLWEAADLAAWSPRLFGAGAAGSREMLSAIATSMITVAGVVFSITIVTLSLTSTQYSPRVLRNFMRDEAIQVVLGVFVGGFAYCLVVLRTIRAGDEGAFIPSLAVLGGMSYAFAGIAVLIYFIHHVARSIQAASILARIAAETRAAIDHLFPQELGGPGDGEAPDAAMPALPAAWQVVAATRDGYVTGVASEDLLALAQATGRVVRICVPVGAFVAEGEPLVALAGAQPPDAGTIERLRACLPLASQRTVEQDAAFGLQQLVDVALRALSPGVNDPATACMCIDQLGALLARLARRRMPQPLRFDGGTLRVIAPVPDLGAMLAETLHPLIRQGRGDLQVLERLIDAVARIGAATSAVRRAPATAATVEELLFELRRVRPRADAVALLGRMRALQAGAAFPAQPADPGQ